MTGLYKKGEIKTNNKTAAAGPDKIRLVKARIRLGIEYTTKDNVVDDNTQMQTNPLFSIFSGSVFSSPKYSSCVVRPEDKAYYL